MPHTFRCDSRRNQSQISAHIRQIHPPYVEGYLHIDCAHRLSLLNCKETGLFLRLFECCCRFVDQERIARGVNQKAAALSGGNFDGYTNFDHANGRTDGIRDRTVLWNYGLRAKPTADVRVIQTGRSTDGDHGYFRRQRNPQIAQPHVP